MEVRPFCELKTVRSLILFLDLIAVSACVAAEFTKTEVGDLKLIGELCSLPGSPAFGLGIAASICLLAAQIIGSSLIGWRRKDFNANEPRKGLPSPIILLILSWISFAFAITLLGVATSMNKKQRYGEGWMNGDCYVVRKGVYIGTAMVALLTTTFALAFTFAVTGRRCHPTRQEKERKHTNTHNHYQTMKEAQAAERSPQPKLQQHTQRRETE